MKKITSLILSAFTVLLVDAQTQIVDLSTGVSTYNIPSHPLDFDARWTVLAPGSSTYQPVNVGTGNYYSANLGIIGTTAYPPNSRWLSPYLYTTPNRFDSGTQQVEIGDFYSSHHDEGAPSIPNGDFIYKTTFTTNNASPCTVAKKARIDIAVMTGLGEAEQILINGHPYSLGAPSGPNCLSHPQNDLTKGWRCYDAVNQCGSFGLVYYTLTLLPSHIHNGSNSIHVVIKKDPTFSSTFNGAFLCTASLNIEYGNNPAFFPKVSLAGSVTASCTGNNSINVMINNAGSYSVAIYSDVNLSQQVYNTNTNITSPNSSIIFPITLPNPLYASIYYVVVTNNDPNNTNCTLIKPITISPCNIAIWNPNPYNDPAIARNVTGTPINDEYITADTKIKWSIEELDAFTGESLFMIDNPECWEASNAVGASNTFNGFNFENDYSGLVTTISCNDEPGVFAPDRVYRITRSYKIMDEEWESSSFMIGPGYDDLQDEKRTAVALAGEVDIDLFDLAHDRENDQMQLISSIDYGTIEVLDILGNKMIGINLQAEQFNYLLSTKGFAAGVYVVSMKSGNQILTKKFMVE